MQHADTFKHPMRTGDDVTVVDMRHLGRTKRQLIVDKGAFLPTISQASSSMQGTTSYAASVLRLYVLKPDDCLLTGSWAVVEGLDLQSADHLVGWSVHH